MLVKAAFVRRGSSAKGSLDDVATAIESHVKSVAATLGPTLSFTDPQLESAFHRISPPQKNMLSAILNASYIVAIISIQAVTNVLLGRSLVACLAALIPPLSMLGILFLLHFRPNLLNHWEYVPLFTKCMLGPLPVGIAAVFDPAGWHSSLVIFLTSLTLINAVHLLRLRYFHFLMYMTLCIPVWAFICSYRLNVVPAKIQSAEFIEMIGFSCILGLTAMLFGYTAFDMERSLRMQFLSDHQFVNLNFKLSRQLKGLESNFQNKVTDLDSPLEKAINMVKQLMANPSVPVEQLKTLQSIVECLKSPNLTTPDFDSQLRRGTMEVDDEQQKWLFAELAKKTAILPSIASLASSAASSYERLGPKSNIKSHDSVRGGSKDTYRTPEAKNLLMTIDDFNWKIFDFVSATKDHALLALSHHLCVQSGLVERLGMPNEKFIAFMTQIEAGYRNDLTFHNSVHGCDVLHCVSYLASREKIAGVFNDLEYLAIYVAAAVHDFQHPGVNNLFLMATNDPLALMYNDKSVLENHHCSSAFQLLHSKPAYNFTAGMDKKQYKAFREMVVEMVLATDLAHHFSLLTNFKKKISVTGDNAAPNSPGHFDPVSVREDRMLLMQILIKCSDVSNPTKNMELYTEWIIRVTEEFFSQGDREKSLGLPVSPYCNRPSPADGPLLESASLASSQKGFIDFIVMPLFDALNSWVEIPVIINGLKKNREHFVALAEKHAAAAAATSAAANTPPTPTTSPALNTPVVDKRRTSTKPA